MTIVVPLIRDMPELGHRAGDSVVWDPLGAGQLHVVANVSAYDFPQLLASVSPEDAAKLRAALGSKPLLVEALQAKLPDGFKSERRRSHKPQKGLRVEKGGAS